MAKKSFLSLKSLKDICCNDSSDVLHYADIFAALSNSVGKELLAINIAVNRAQQLIKKFDENWLRSSY